MLVVGGSYRELCIRPERDEMWGSGLRAAAALSDLSPGVRLVTGLDGELDAAARIMASAHGVELEAVTRNEPVSFSYFTPLSPPFIGGRTARLRDRLQVNDDVVLAYGMVEAGEIRVQSRSLILDPQRPRELAEIPMEGFRYERLALILNRVEAATLSGRDEPEESAAELARRYRAEVVVVKCGAMGAVVHYAGSTTGVGAFQTDRVFAIGSGDVFAAGFAWAWGERGMSPVEAARVGSLSAAWWCSGGLLPVPIDVGQMKTDLPELKPRSVQVYLAAPFFTLAELWLVGLCRDTMRAFGARVFSPVHDVGRQVDDIASQDLKGLDSSDAILAILDGADSGTWFEVGWARKQGKPVVAYCDPKNEQQLKMALGTQVEVHSDLSTAVYRAVWAPQT